MFNSDAIERLQSLRVEDVMSRDVQLVSGHQTMEEVATAFRKSHISSAPVINESGRCIGMISASDFLKRDASTCEPHVVVGDVEHHHLAEPTEGESLSIETDNHDAVSQYMTDAVQAVVPQATLLQAARMMSAEHIHHLPVLDEQHQIVGVISTMDVTAALVNAIDEMNR